MPNNKTTCDPAALDRLLADSLADVERLALEEHLDGCAACRDRLERQAAEPALWAEARDFLSSADREIPVGGLDAPHLATSAAARLRFAREARAAAAVVHENVIAIHAVSEANGLPYLVMPYVRGTSLQKRLDAQGAFAVPEILRIGMQTARGLAAA